MRGIAIVLTVAGCLAGCSSSEVLVAHSVPLVAATETIPEPQLLDVGVALFDPGVPAGEIDKEVLEELIREGTFVSIRRAEAMYMAVLLRDTLQNSGHWGSVWVTPEPSTAADLNVNAEILHSDGDILELKVRAVDATGRVWINDKKYDMSTAAGSFNRQRYPNLDPYQDVFNSIANDLAAVRAQLTAADHERIRTVGQLRYAAELSPEAFSGYVVEEKGAYKLNRLPADGDPMFDRTQRVRQREKLFIETLDQHYAKFYNDARPSYDSWREYAREEAIALRELTRSARWRTGMGVATILASLVYGSNSNNDSFSDRVIRDAMMYVGMDMLRTSAVRRQEKRLHTEALEELSSSFDDEVEPMVVEIQGVQHRLTGTAQVQYQEWRELLKQMFISETGFVPEEVVIYTEPEPTLPPETLETGAPAEFPADGSAPGGAEASSDGSGDGAESTGGAAEPAGDAPATDAAPGSTATSTSSGASDANAEPGAEPLPADAEVQTEAVSDATSEFRTGA